MIHADGKARESCGTSMLTPRATCTGIKSGLPPRTSDEGAHSPRDLAGKALCCVCVCAPMTAPAGKGRAGHKTNPHTSQANQSGAELCKNNVMQRIASTAEYYKAVRRSQHCAEL